MPSNLTQQHHAQMVNHVHDQQQAHHAVHDSQQTNHSTSSSGRITPQDTNGHPLDRSSTPPNAPITVSTSSTSTPNQVEGKPSPPPGLSPVHQQQSKQQFVYNGRQVQVVVPSNISPSANSLQAQQQQRQQQQAQFQQQQQQQQAQLQYQMQLAAFQQQQQLMQMQQLQQQTAVASRTNSDSRRSSIQQQQQPGQPQQQQGPPQARPQQYPNAQQAAYYQQAQLYPQSPAGNTMTYEMYQQMLFASGTIDANTFAQAVASGQVLAMYQAMMAGSFYPATPAVAMQQEAAAAAYALQLQQQAYFNSVADINGGAGTPTGSSNFRGKAAGPGASPLLPSPVHFVDYNNPAYVPQQPYLGYPVSGGNSPTDASMNARDSQLLADQHQTNRQFREGHSHQRQRSHQTSDGSEGHLNVNTVSLDDIQGNATIMSNLMANNKTPPQPSTYKTEICKSFQATGSCEYGASCQFSHGAHELRSREVDSKYKTELCKNFHSQPNTINGVTPPPPHVHGSGSCWYGNRCRFLHDEFRLRQSANEFWLVAPSDNLIRVERVQPSATAEQRIEQLTELLQSEHNHKQTMLYADTVGCLLNGELNEAAFKQHMDSMMSVQLSSQGEAQIHCREMAPLENPHRRERKEHASMDQHHQRDQHHHHQQHQAAAAYVHAMQHQDQHDALVASAVARLLPSAGASSDKSSRVVAITPIMPLNQLNSGSNNMASHQQMHSGVIISNTPVVIANSPSINSPTPATTAAPVTVSGPMSYARKVATAVAAAPVAPVSAPPAPITTAPKPAPVAPVKPTVIVAPTPRAPISILPADSWQTKVAGKRHKFAPVKDATSEEQKEQEFEKHDSQSIDADEEATMNHIIAKLQEVEMKSKQAADNMD